MDIPFGYCHCGCGRKTEISNENRPTRGRFLGQPNRYIHGHQGRGKTFKKPMEQKFWKHVRKGGQDECWIWIGAKENFGYGKIHADGRIQSAHRVSYEMFCGKIPDGIYVLHKCDNPSCVNPNHLFLGTHQDNMNDMCDKGRIARALTIEKAREIKVLIANGGKTYSEIAKMYNVGKSIISAIARGKKWKRA